MPGAFPGHPYVITPAAAAAAQAAAAASQEQYLALTAAAGQAMLPLHYYAATGFPAPCYPQPGHLLANGATPPGLPPGGQSANTRPLPAPGQRPPSPAGSQTGSVTPGPGQENPGGPASLPANPGPYQMIPAYYDAKGALVQLPGAGGLPPPVRLLPSPAPHGAHLSHTFSTLSNPVNLGSPISSISGSGNFGGRRDSLDRISNPPFSPSLDFTKTKGGWGGAAGGLAASYGAVGSIASPGLAGLAGSTGSLTPPPSMTGLNLGLFGVNNRLAPGADRAFALGAAGAGLYPGARPQPTLGASMGPMGAIGVGAIPFGSLITGAKSRHNSNVDKNSNRSRMLEDFR